MGYLLDIVCSHCKQKKTIHVSNYNHPTICDHCEIEIANEECEKHLLELSKLPVKQRLRLIEKWIYEYKPQYVGEPRIG